MHDLDFDGPIRRVRKCRTCDLVRIFSGRAYSLAPLSSTSSVTVDFLVQFQFCSSATHFPHPSQRRRRGVK